MGKLRDVEYLVSWVRSQFMFPQFQLGFLGAIPVPEVRSRNSLFMEDRVRRPWPIRALYWGQLTNQRPSCLPISRPDHAGAQFQMCRRFETNFGFRHRPGLGWLYLTGLEVWWKCFPAIQMGNRPRMIGNNDRNLLDNICRTSFPSIWPSLSM